MVDCLTNIGILSSMLLHDCQLSATLDNIKQEYAAQVIRRETEMDLLYMKITKSAHSSADSKFIFLLIWSFSVQFWCIIKQSHKKDMK